MKYSGERFLPEECKGEMAIEHYQRYKLACQLADGKVVLDAACGEGYGSSLIAQHAKKTIGIDIDESSINDASKRYKTSGLSFLCSDISRLPFEDASFDMAVSFETIEHVDEKIQHAFLSELKRVLKPDGILLMSTPNKAVYTDKVSGYNQFHVKEFYVEEFLDFLHRSFSEVEALCQFPDVGYYIAPASKAICMVHNGCQIEEGRYIVAICSNQKIDCNINFNTLGCFDDSMYYSLNARVHELEAKVLNTKEEAETFQAQLEQSIVEQKEYIAHLEHSIAEQKEYVMHLEKDIVELKEYIRSLREDKENLKKV